jgi:hypothetical protein
MQFRGTPKRGHKARAYVLHPKPFYSFRSSFTAVLLGAVTLLASYIPSRPAATTDPIAALRFD